jgi:DNA-binding transcriptional ArsR family regulator
MSRPPLLEISSAEMCKSLLSPVRVEVTEFLRSNGEATVSELAAMLCRSPELLYRHLDILMKSGLVVQTGYRKKGRHVERVYDVAADDIFLAFKGRGTPADNDAIVDMMGSFSRVIDRTIRRATAARLVDYEAMPRQLMIRYEMSWLTTGDLVQLHDLIARIKAIMDEGRKKRQGSVYRWMAVLCPFSEKSGSEKSRTKRTSAKKNSSTSRLAAADPQKSVASKTTRSARTGSVSLSRRVQGNPVGAQAVPSPRPKRKSDITLRKSFSNDKKTKDS